MVFHDAVEAHRAADLGQLAEAVGCAFLLFLKGSDIVGFSVDPDRVTTQELGGLGPLAVVLDGLLAFGGIRVAEGSFAIAHDEQAAHPFAVGPVLEFLQVARVFDLVFEELVDQFYAVQVVRSTGHDGEVHVGHLLPKQGLVVRPLSQADLEGSVPLLGRPQGTPCGGQDGGHRCLTKKVAAIHGDGWRGSMRISGPGPNHPRLQQPPTSAGGRTAPVPPRRPWKRRAAPGTSP